MKPEAVLVSLAPKLTIARLAEGLGGFQRIVRMIPNAPSIIEEQQHIQQIYQSKLEPLFKKLKG